MHLGSGRWSKTVAVTTRSFGTTARLGTIGAVTFLVVSAAWADVEIQFIDLPAAQPSPTHVSGYAMTAYDLHDPRFRPGGINPTLDAWSDAVPTHVTTFGGATFTHRTVGLTWATWSGTYAGSVYRSPGGKSNWTLELTSGTLAYYFYLEPSPFSLQNFQITVYGSQGDSATTTGAIHGMSGAARFDVWASAGWSIDRIEIVSLEGVDFAVGQFGYALVPTPGAVSLAALAFACGRRRRRDA